MVVVVHASRAYPQGCSIHDPSYYDYETTTEFPSSWITEVPLKNKNDYKLVRRIGTGKFSDVFEAMPSSPQPPQEHDDTSLSSEHDVIIKCLKPVSERKIKREIFILQKCLALANVVQLLAIVTPTTSSSSQTDVCYTIPDMPSLVMKHAGTNSQWLCHHSSLFNQPKDHPITSNNNTDQRNNGELSDYEIRYFLFQLLLALDGLHAMGIMHRDVKPRNVLIDRTQKTLVLIDLGLADFYHPHAHYNVRVASRHYKAPELLTNHPQYDYAIDMWGVGCILAGLLWKQEPFFPGKDNIDQLERIVRVLGVRDLLRYLHKYQLDIPPEIQQILHEYAHYNDNDDDDDDDGNDIQSNRKSRNDHWCSAWRKSTADDESDPPLSPPEDGIDLLNQLLVYDPDERLTAQEAMAHPFFDAVRDTVIMARQNNWATTT